MRDSKEDRARGEITIFILNVRGMSREARLKELEQEAHGCKRGILLIQETWRPETAEKLNIGDRRFCGLGTRENPRGNGTGVLVHKDIKVESWHHITSRITAIRIPYGKRHLMIFFAYAPVQQGGSNSMRTTQFCEQLTGKTREARMKGDIFINWEGHERIHQAKQRPTTHRQMG